MMVTQNKPNQNVRSTAELVGILFLAAMVASLVGGGLVEAVISAPDYLSHIAENETQLLIGVLLELVNGIAVLGIGVLTSTGKYVACAFNPTTLFIGGLMSKKNGKGASSLVAKSSPDDLVFIKELLESGAVVPVVDRRYPLQELAEAMQYLGSSQQHGKVVITL
jgi:D-arabinose 1-dehydrogenase-like Zn-dependent alcohol dehydrogenase